MTSLGAASHMLDCRDVFRQSAAEKERYASDCGDMVGQQGQDRCLKLWKRACTC